MLVMAGMTGFGLALREKEEKRVEELITWEYIFRLLEGQISYQRQPLPLACMEIGAKVGSKEGKMLRQLGEAMEAGQEYSFVPAWNRKWQEYRKLSFLTKAEQAMVGEMAVFTGIEEEDLLKSLLERQQERIGSYRKKLQEEEREKKRIILWLSSFGGLLLVLILL
jgi:stage III sporulation protein AB